MTTGHVYVHVLGQDGNGTTIDITDDRTTKVQVADVIARLAGLYLPDETARAREVFRRRVPAVPLVHPSEVELVDPDNKLASLADVAAGEMSHNNH
jgi:hypothetical protein